MDYLKFFNAITAVKQISRTGWVREGIRNPESVADHSFGITMLAMIFADKFDKPLDKEKLMKMALIHDIGELAFGDTVIDRGAKLADQKQIDEKNQQEKRKIREVFALIGDEKEYEQLFTEIIETKTQEAKIIKQLDKLEMVMQACTYEKQQERNLEEWFVNAGFYIKEPLLKKIFHEIVKKRKYQIDTMK